MNHKDNFDINLDKIESYDYILKELNVCMKILQSNGILIKPGSRLLKYKKVVDNFLKAKDRMYPAEKVDLQLFHQTSIEFEQIHTIVKEFSRPPVINGWIEVVDKILKGNIYPQNSSEGDRSRDFQFELYLAALSRKGGLKIVLDEPDIIIKYPNFNFSIAAKRVKTYSNLSKNLKKARWQIENSGHDGIVAVDISRLFNPKNLTMGYFNHSDTYKKLIDITDRFINNNRKKIMVDISSDHVFGIIAYSGVLTRDLNKLQYGHLKRITISSLCEETDIRYGILKDFTLKLSKALN